VARTPPRRAQFDGCQRASWHRRTGGYFSNGSGDYASLSRRPPPSVFPIARRRGRTTRSCRHAVSPLFQARRGLRGPLILFRPSGRRQGRPRREPSARQGRTSSNEPEEAKRSAPGMAERGPLSERSSGLRAGRDRITRPSSLQPAQVRPTEAILHGPTRPALRRAGRPRRAGRIRASLHFGHYSARSPRSPPSLQLDRRPDAPIDAPCRRGSGSSPRPDGPSGFLAALSRRPGQGISLRGPRPVMTAILRKKGIKAGLRPARRSPSRGPGSSSGRARPPPDAPKSPSFRPGPVRSLLTPWSSGPGGRPRSGAPPA